MKRKPAYFEPIRLKAARRWHQLEQDPELAGPWHLLFRQVQSPRHVLSELLQNADDAGATEASVRVENQIFVFQHNGEDFAKEHFASLCRFGYSNKRTLHTIGFRGIGFKSTFSLGDCVELFTPTLAVSFDRKRFTEPRWQPVVLDTDGRTCIRVAIRDQACQKEVEENFSEWLKSPISLLFFKSIRRLEIGDRVVKWNSVGLGPIPDSEWMTLDGQESAACLLVRSKAEAFPEDALAEIKQERMLSVEEETEFPPSRIEIVMGAKGCLFVVLPTGVESELPFAINAPFIQDPARLKIKDPGISPTNRWLLRRAGQLAASAMLEWVGQSGMPVEQRAAAYGLFPDVNRENSSLEGVCGTVVEKAFEKTIEGRPFLLTDDGNLTRKKESVILPPEIVAVWPASQAAALLDETGRPALSPHIETAHQKKFLRWRLVEEIDKSKVVAALKSRHLPKPKTWRRLLNLWKYIAPEFIGYWSPISVKDVRVVPVQGKDVLYSAEEVARLGDKKLLQSEDDWQFLAKHLLVLNPNWPRFLASERRRATAEEDTSALQTVEAASAVLQKMELTDASAVDKVIARVSAEFFAGTGLSVQDCVRLAQIAAKLGAAVGDTFQYVTRDRYRRPATNGILFDENGTLEELLPVEKRQTQMLHADYAAKYSSCSEEEWRRWIASGRSGLGTLPPLHQLHSTIYGRAQVEQEARTRGLTGALSYRYVTREFILADWDFEEIFWSHWKALATADDRLWMKVANRLLTQSEAYWSQAKSARLFQVATTRNVQSMTQRPLLPAWVLRFRELPCLPDTRGFRQRPGDLLRRTPETEPLLEVEPFIDAHLDTEKTRPLLDLLGVRSTPTGPDRLLDCLRALSKAEKPPIHEVDKWYRRLDRMADTCSTLDLYKVREAFRSEKLILAEDGSWTAAAAVFLASDEEDAPGTSTVRSSVADLMLWRKIGLAERPTVDLAIKWLKGLPSGHALSPEDARRVRALLSRHPVRIWEECAHWLNLAGEWTSTEGLVYALTMQSLIRWQHLHPWVKQKTADLQRQRAEVTSTLPFSVLSPLAEHIEERIHLDPLLAERPERKDWLTTLGTELRRVELDDEEQTQHARSVAESLTKTVWHTTVGLECIPYIDGTPAGTPRQVDVLWLDDTLYVDQLPKAKLARRVPEEIGKAFDRTDIKAALDYSFERSPDDVREYMEQNFKLAPRAEVPEIVTDGTRAEPAEKSATLSPEPAAGMQYTASAPDGIDGETAMPTDAGDGASAAEQPDGVEQRDEQGMPGILSQPATHPRPVSKPAKPSIIERFAKSQGFRKDGNDRFFLDDGSWLGRTRDNTFPWERRAASGDLVRFYWPKDHCLEREPLQLEADVWWLIDKHPESYALILASIQDDAIEVTGDQLRAMLADNEITLYPSTYRLVHNVNGGI